MKILKVQYVATIPEGTLDQAKKQLGVDTDEELIGVFKSLIKSQSEFPLKEINMSIVSDKPNVILN